jgi:hypothetical protein
MHRYINIGASTFKDREDAPGLAFDLLSGGLFLKQSRVLRGSGLVQRSAGPVCLGVGLGRLFFDLLRLRCPLVVAVRKRRSYTRVLI